MTDMKLCLNPNDILRLAACLTPILSSAINAKTTIWGMEVKSDLTVPPDMVVFQSADRRYGYTIDSVELTRLKGEQDLQQWLTKFGEAVLKKQQDALTKSFLGEKEGPPTLRQAIDDWSSRIG